MTESEFHRQVDETLLRIEEALDASGADVDYENAGGVLTLRFEDGSQIILNRQTPARQLWVAARSGGYHFDYDPTGARWRRDSDQRELFESLSEWASAQAGTSLRFAHDD
jgi:CyaY protein